MGGEWTKCRIEEVAERVAMGPFGSSIKVETFVPEGVPVISGQHLHGYRLDDKPGYNFITPEHAERLRNANVRRGDVVFTHAGNIGQVAYIPCASAFEGYVISQRQFYLRPDQSKVLPEFLVAYFRSPEGQHKLLANTSQVGVPSIAQPVTYLRSLEIPLPPLSEQRAIAHILGTLDDKIELLRRQNETLEAIARRLFKSWFVDFDPVRAKAAGEKPAGLPDDLAALFPDRLVDSELGEIPEGWQQSTLAAVASLNPETWTTRKHPDEIDYLDLSNVKDGVIEAPTRYSWDDAPSRARRVLQRGDTIIGTVRPGNRSFALIDEAGLTGSTGFAVLRPLNEVNREFLYIASTSDDAIERLAHLADGAAYPAVRPEVVLATEIVMPTEEVMAAFSAVTKNIFDLASICRQESKVLASIRDLLLPRLISGKLRVGETKSLIEEAIA